MHFRELGNGDYFPPIIPNGMFMASPRAGYPVQEIFQVRDEGLFAGGVFLLWDEITGIAFLTERCEHRTSRRTLVSVQGYPVVYCLMNRVTFEQQHHAAALVRA